MAFTENSINNASSSLNVTGSTAPVNGIYLPSANTLGISSNSVPVAVFNSPGAGGDYLILENVASSGQNSITAPTALTCALAGAGAGNLGAGAYSYKVTYVSPTGETAAGTASNTTTVVTPSSNGKMALSAIPTSANGTVTARNIYRTVAGGSAWYFLHQIADNTTVSYTDNIADSAIAQSFTPPTANGNIPVFVNIATTSAGSSDSAVGMTFNTIGTTTRGGQFNNAQNIAVSPVTSGNYNFNINSNPVLTITDNYFNPNTPYGGIPDGKIVISSGNSAGSAETSAVVSAEISNAATATSATLRLNSKGEIGEIHFITNGYTSASVESGTNPNGNNLYNDSYYIGLSGVPFGYNGWASMNLQSSTNVFSDATASINFIFYLASTGDYVWASDNTATAMFRMYRTANAVNQLYSKASATGGISLLGVGGTSYDAVADANATLGLTAAGTGSVLIYNQAGVNPLAQFTNTANAVNVVSMTGGATGFGPTISAAGTDTDIGLSYATKSNGIHNFISNGTTAAQIQNPSASSVNYIYLTGNTTGNYPAIAAEGTDAAVGLLIYTSGTGSIQFKTNNTVNSIMTLLNNGSVQLNSGKITTYNNVATAGQGVPSIYGFGRVTAQTAAAAAITTYTVGAADGSFLVSGNVLVTAATTASFTMTVTYTDEGNTSRTLTLTFSSVAGTLLSTITNVTGTGAYEGVPLHIRAKASTSITFATVGTFTSVTYNAEGQITQIA